MLCQIEITRCANNCGTTYLSPYTTCPLCNPIEHHREEERWRANAEEVRAICMDRYAFDMLAQRLDGSFVLVRDAYHVMRSGEYGYHDALILDLTAMRKENTELHAENSRLRRRLEKTR